MFNSERVSQNQTDFVSFTDHSITLLTPVTNDAKQWCENNLDPDCQKLGFSYAIDSRYFLDIYNGINNDGLTIN